MWILETRNVRCWIDAERWGPNSGFSDDTWWRLELSSSEFRVQIDNCDLLEKDCTVNLIWSGVEMCFLVFSFSDTPCTEIGDPLEFGGVEEGIFLVAQQRRKRERKEWYFLLPCFSSRPAVEGGGGGSPGHGNSLSGAKPRHFLAAVFYRGYSK